MQSEGGRSRGAARALARGLRRAAIALAPDLFLRALAPDREELGKLGEELAARHLLARGWRILGRRVATPCGEVDLFAERGARRAIVEVKAAHRARGQRVALAALRFRPGHRLNGRRLARLQRAARWLARGGPTPEVDLIEVSLGARGRPVEIVHHEDLRRPLP